MNPDSSTVGASDLNVQLLKAVFDDDVSRVKLLINAGADVNSEEKLEEYGAEYTPLIISSWYGYDEVVRELLQIPSIEVNKEGVRGDTALGNASRAGNIEVVKVLLEKDDIDVNLGDSRYGGTSLQTAAANGQTEVVEALLKTPGILVNKKNAFEWTALHFAAKGGWLEVVKLLLNVRGVAVNEKESANEDTPLHLAANFRHSGVVEELLNHTDIDVNAKDKLGQNAFHLSAFYGETRTVKMLLKAGVDAGAKTNLGHTACYWAGKQGHHEVVKIITDHIKNSSIYVNSNDSLSDLATLLLVAAKKGDSSKVEELLKRPGVDINSMDQSRNTPLHLVSKEGYAEIVKLLLRQKYINVNARNTDRSRLTYPVHAGDNPHLNRLDIGITPLFLAVQGAHVEVVKLLVNHPEVDVNVCDKYGKSPLYLAVDHGNLDIVKVLLKRPEIDVNLAYLGNDHYTSLHTAVERGSLDIAKMLLRHPKIDVNLKDKYYKCTPLHMAVRRNDFEAVKAILSDPKVDVNTKDKFTNTPLHDAAGKGKDLDIFKLLLKAGANTHITNISGKTPLEM